MMIGIIASVISIIADNTYAALPNTCDKAEPSDLERSSGIVESVRRIAARTIERKATGEAAALVISPSEAREEMNIMTASTMKKAKMRKLLLLILILPAMLLAGCSKEEEQVVLESVSITDAGVQMKVGEEHQLEFSYLPSGIERPAAQWVSSNSTVATVNADGLVKAMKEGTATITLTATSQGIVLTDECTITVTNVEATAITLSENTLELKAGETFDLHYTIEPENTTVKDVE